MSTPEGATVPPSDPAGSGSPSSRSRVQRLVRLAAAVGNADAEEIDAVARQLGSSRSYLAPIAWGAGTIVLLLRGIKLLVLNWRLTLIQLVPAVVIWLVMYDLRLHALRRAEFLDLSIWWVIAGFVVAIAAMIASFWCNVVFAFAIDDLPPRIAPAIAQAHLRLRLILIAGTALGLVLGTAVVVVPKLERYLLFDAVLLSVLGIMVVSFVAVPARILQRRQRKLAPREAMGSLVMGWALSAVVMTPGFVLDRVGVIMMGVPKLRILGFLVLSLGTALYAAGMTSVKAVKLSAKLAVPGSAPSSGATDPASDGSRSLNSPDVGDSQDPSQTVG